MSNIDILSNTLWGPYGSPGYDGSLIKWKVFSLCDICHLAELPDETKKRVNGCISILGLGLAITICDAEKSSEPFANNVGCQHKSGQVYIWN